MTSLRQAAACLIAALLIPALAIAAEIPIDGCVTVPGGRPASGARAELRPFLSMYAEGVRALQGQGEPEPVLRAVTDDEGCFALRAPDAGMWRVTVEAPGFVPMEHRLIPLLEEASLPLLELERDVGLRVRIEEASGKPLPGARVRMIRTSPASRTAWAPALREGVTGADGGLRLPKSTVEIFDLWAAAPGWLPRQRPQVHGDTLSLRLDRGVLRTLEITRAEDGKPLAGALIVDNASRLVLGRGGTTGEIALATPALDRFEILTLGADGRITGSWIRAKVPEVERISLALPGPAMIQGGVEDSASRRPLVGALVWPEHDPAAFVKATAKGKFRLPWTPGSGVRVAAAAPGTLQSLEKPRAATPPLRIALEPALRLDGTVVDAEGQPVAGAEVRALAKDPEDSESLGVQRSRSDAAGRFRLPLGAGNYVISAARSGFAPAFSGATLPGKRLPVRLVLRPGRSLTGLVVDGEGRPVHGAEVELMRNPEWIGMAALQRPGSLRSHRARTGPNGRFEVRDLPSSWFHLRIEHPDFVPHEREDLIVPDGPGPVEAGTFALETGLTVEGVVVDSQGQPLPDTALWLRPQPGDDQLFLRRGPRQVTGQDGRFSIPHLEPEEDWTLYACRQGHPEVIVHSHEVAPGPLRIVLAPARRMTGRVVDTDGNPVPGAYVRAGLAGEFPDGRGDSGRPPCSGSDKFPFAYTDGEGRFVLGPLRTGFYDLQADAEGFLDMEPVRLEVGENREPQGTELVLDRGATLIGRIFTADGSPAAGAIVQVEGDQTRAGEDGSYRLQGIETGWHSVLGRHDSFTKRSSAKSKVELSSGENRLDIHLEPGDPKPGQEVQGHVVGPEGEPIEGAQVSVAAVGSEAFTGPDGSFTLTLLDNRFPIMAWKEGYSVSRANVDLHNLPPGGVEIRLEKGLTLTGRLLGLDPSEIPSARVEILKAAVPHPSTVFPDGTYRIVGLGPGESWVSAKAGARTTEAKVTLGVGEEGATLDLVFLEQFDVRGRVLDPDGQGIAAKIYIAFQSRPTTIVESLEDGSFEVRLESGDYQIEAFAPGHQPTASRSFTVADAPVDGLDIQMEGGHVLRGCIHDLLSRKAPGDQIPWIQADNIGGTAVTADLDAEGCYKFDTLSQGNWTLRASLNEDRPGERHRGVHTEVVIRPGTEAVADLDFFLGDLTLSGRVETTGEPPELWAALLLPEGNLVISDPDVLKKGAFYFGRLRAGRYRLQIKADGSEILLEQPVDLASDQEIVVSLPGTDAPR